MGRKIEELALEVVTNHEYTWRCPECLKQYERHGGKKISFIIYLMQQHGVKKVDGKLICGNCINKK